MIMIKFLLKYIVEDDIILIVAKNNSNTERRQPMKVRRWVVSEKVREMCIRNGYYTCGDNRAYESMLANARDVDDQDFIGLKDIAIDIYYHSKMQYDDEYTKAQYIEGILYGILTECTDMYVELDEGEV